MSGKNIECIQLNLFEGYNIDNPYFPNVLCSGCHLELFKKEKSDTCEWLPSKMGKRFAFCCKIWMPNFWGCQDGRHNLAAHAEKKWGR